MPRPRKFPIIEEEEQPQDIVDEIAKVYQELTCPIEGCKAKFHHDEALRIYQALKKRGLAK